MSGTDLLKNPELRSNKVNLFDLFAGKSKETLSTMQESLGWLFDTKLDVLDKVSTMLDGLSEHGSKMSEPLIALYNRFAPLASLLGLPFLSYSTMSDEQAKDRSSLNFWDNLERGSQQYLVGDLLWNYSQQLSQMLTSYNKEGGKFDVNKVEGNLFDKLMPSIPEWIDKDFHEDDKKLLQSISWEALVKSAMEHSSLFSLTYLKSHLSGKVILNKDHTSIDTSKVNEKNIEQVLLSASLKAYQPSLMYALARATEWNTAISQPRAIAMVLGVLLWYNATSVVYGIPELTYETEQEKTPNESADPATDATPVVVAGAGAAAVVGSVENIDGSWSLVPVSSLTLSPLWINFIKQHEWFHSTSYQDSWWVRTIGYGTTTIDWKPVWPWQTITEPKALILFHEQLKKIYIPPIYKLVTVPLSQGMVDALVSFCYNCWEWNLKHITDIINKWNYTKAADEMQKYVKDKKWTKLDGLVTRRAYEKERFLDGYIEQATV